jgi:MFS transporter, PHS family, inorganic phosphate transporter
VLHTIDNGGFKWSVWAVAATGFFTDSYNLFATNVVIPILLYVYWPTTYDENGQPKNDSFGNNANVINLLTLAGSMVGQVLFGFLADNYGRQRLYGIELIVVIFTTIGLTESSSGRHGSMQMLGWLCAWRFLMGVGIGAEYPLSAVITAE